MLRRALLILPLALAACAASSQPAATPSTAATPKIYTLTVTEQEVFMIGGALAEHAYRDVSPLIQKLQKQVDDQDKAAAKSK